MKPNLFNCYCYVGEGQVEGGIILEEGVSGGESQVHGSSRRGRRREEGKVEVEPLVFAFSLPEWRCRRRNTHPILTLLTFGSRSFLLLLKVIVVNSGKGFSFLESRGGYGQRSFLFFLGL